MIKLPHHTALKEWSNVVAALARGEQIILIRKGGIADATFGVEAQRFYLYPTYFHQGESEARASVVISHWSEVVRTWRVHDTKALEKLAPMVVMPGDTLLARFHFRPDQALYVIALRTWELAQPAEVRFREDYGGCRSWISLEDEIDIDASRPVLAEEALETKMADVDRALAEAGAAG